jgi:hypothetical protein
MYWTNCILLTTNLIPTHARQRYERTEFSESGFFGRKNPYMPTSIRTHARSHTHSYIHTHERQLLFWHIHTCIMLVCPFHRYQRNLYMTRDSHRHTDRNYVYYCYYCYYFYFYYDYRNLARIKRDLYQRTLEMTRDSHRHWDRFSLSFCLYVYWSVCLLLAAFVSCHI